MLSWAEQELADAKLPDVRLLKRLIKIVDSLTNNPGASVPEASGDWATTKATYNFWDSSRISAEDIRESHCAQAFNRAREDNVVLAIQDTTDFDFTHHPKTKDLGPIASQWYVQGLKVHSVLGATTLLSATWIISPRGLGKRPRGIR